MPKAAPPSDPVADILVRVQPRAPRNELVGWREGALVIRVASPPVAGAANRACGKFLAQLLDVAPSGVTLEAGDRSRDKRFRVAGLTPEAARAKIDELLRAPSAAGAERNAKAQQSEGRKGDKGIEEMRRQE